MNTQKRKRAVNFKLKENRILVDLVLKYQHIIENKQSDCVSWANKKEAWAAIEKEFNVSSGQSFRTAEALHAKYETIKKDIRKKAAAIKKSIFLTGGGQESSPEYLDFEEKLLRIIYMSIEGLSSIGDSHEVNFHKKVETQAQDENICQDVVTMVRILNIYVTC
ncbi:Myb/SANT-like DNA-binding domain [Popillia japonica]|uniref:Regulatory protein zeste n=1 Tax=Popillia japonica TaxID=7064 RepID=A0AAW1KJ25_POPJA